AACRREPRARDGENVSVRERAAENVSREHERLVTLCAQQRENERRRVPQHQFRGTDGGGTAPEAPVPEHARRSEVREKVNDAIAGREQAIGKKNWRKEERVEECETKDDCQRVFERGRYFESIQVQGWSGVGVCRAAWPPAARKASGFPI